MFAKHHYLDHSHNNAGHVYIAFINDVIAGFLSVLHLPHPKSKNLKKVHRLVVLPDYQGAGFGIKFLNFIGKHYKEQGYRYLITTSTPALIHALKKRDQWALTRYGRQKKLGKDGIAGIMGTSRKRITGSFELIETDF